MRLTSKFFIPSREKQEPFIFALLAILIGLISGVGAIVFRAMIGLVHNLAFNGHFSWLLDTSLHATSSPWGLGIVLVPVAGAVIVVYLTKNFAPEAKGHGVPEVMDAIYYQRGIIRPFVALIKSVVSAVSIGTGGAVGREGPIIQIGASLGSTLGQVFPMSASQRITLIAAGSGAGIAATFNTPLGGVLFAVELMLHEVSVKTLVPVVLATVTATYVGRVAFGDHPAFLIPHLDTPSLSPLAVGDSFALLLAYVGLGVLMGLGSFTFIQTLYKTEDFIDRFFPRNEYLRHMLGMFAVGLMMYLYLRCFGHYYIQGVGYATIQDVLTRGSLPLALLLILTFSKLLATSLTLGSGASGGIFSPGLFIGCVLGAAYGELLSRSFPGFAWNPTVFAVAGMAGIIGGSTGAALTAIVMTFEMTLDYNVILPITVTVALSYAIRKLLCRESVYTLKLARRGHHMPEALNANFHFLIPAGEIMEPPPEEIPAETSLEAFAARVQKQPEFTYFALKRKNGKLSILKRDQALRASDPDSAGLSVESAQETSFVWVEAKESLLQVILDLKAANADIALVKDNRVERPKGLISKLRIEAAVEAFSDFFH